MNRKANRAIVSRKSVAKPGQPTQRRLAGRAADDEYHAQTVDAGVLGAGMTRPPSVASTVGKQRPRDNTHEQRELRRQIGRHRQRGMFQAESGMNDHLG